MALTRCDFCFILLPEATHVAAFRGWGRANDVLPTLGGHSKRKTRELAWVRRVTVRRRKVDEFQSHLGAESTGMLLMGTSGGRKEANSASGFLPEQCSGRVSVWEAGGARGAHPSQLWPPLPQLHRERGGEPPQPPPASPGPSSPPPQPGPRLPAPMYSEDQTTAPL